MLNTTKTFKSFISNFVISSNCGNLQRDISILLFKKNYFSSQTIRATGQPFHLVDPSPWPLLTSLAIANTIIWLLCWFFLLGSMYNVFLSILLLFFLLINWWIDVFHEAFYQGQHTKRVVQGFRVGMILFILSEVFFFFAFFWAYLHNALNPSIFIGGVWPPQNLIPYIFKENDILAYTVDKISNTSTANFGEKIQKITLPSEIVLTEEQLPEYRKIIKEHYNIYFPPLTAEELKKLEHDKAAARFLVNLPEDVKEYVKEKVWQKNYIQTLRPEIVERLNTNPGFRDKFVVKKVIELQEEARSEVQCKQFNELLSQLPADQQKNLTLRCHSYWNKKNQVLSALIEENYWHEKCSTDFYRTMTSPIVTKNERLKTIENCFKLREKNPAIDEVLKGKKIFDFGPISNDEPFRKPSLGLSFKEENIVKNKLWQKKYLEQFPQDIRDALNTMPLSRDKFINKKFIEFVTNALPSEQKNSADTIHQNVSNDVHKNSSFAVLVGRSTWNAYRMPLAMTLILVISGVTLTASHMGVCNIYGALKNAMDPLIVTLVLAIGFLILQAFEYVNLPISINDGIFGSTFFMATGFHGFHVLVGGIFLTVCLLRLYGRFIVGDSHPGFECAIWYWHFVDIVWIFLFLIMYGWATPDPISILFIA